MRLRPATPDDEAFVAGLVPRFVEHGVADGHTAAEVVDGTRRVLAEALRDGTSRDDVFVVAEDAAGEAVGFIYAVVARDFFTGEPYFHVSELAVTTSGAGIGTALMDHVERLAALRRYRFVSLNIVDENVSGARFYERRGFRSGHRHLVKPLPQCHPELVEG